MSIFRVLYSREVPVGIGGRITIPQEIRDDLRLTEKDALTLRLEEENGTGRRQLSVWKVPPKP